MGAASVSFAPVRLRPVIWLAALVGLIVAAWILGTPPSAGPDEPSHLVRSAALVRGELEGERVRDDQGSARRFDEVPVWVGWPDPACFATFPYTPVACATLLPRPDDASDLDVLEGRVVSSQPQTTRAFDYPVWGHVLPGLGTFAPAEIALQLARGLSAVVPIALIVAALALAARAGPIRATSVLLAVTPTAWFTFAIVNPSAPVIGGAVALWVAATDRTGATWARWLAAAGWAALVLPRRDGLIWGSLSLIAIGALHRTSVLAWLRGLGRGPLAIIAASTAAVIAWGLASDSRVSGMVVAVPLVVVAADVVRWAWVRWPRTAARAGVALLTTGTVIIAAGVVIARRPGGWDERLATEPSVPLFREIVRNSHTHVVEAIGNLGWLDAPLPPLALGLWWIGFGVLVAAVVERGGGRRLALAGSIGLSAVVVPWVLEMYQGNDTGTYWQGRYSLPLLVGVPIVLGAATHLAPGATPTPGDGDHDGDLEERRRQRRLAIALAAVWVVVLNAALYAALRRWAVGLAGTYVPTRWDTYGAVVPPVAVLVVHLGATAGLAGRMIVRSQPTRSAP